MEEFILHTPKAVVFALAALSSKSKEEVVEQLALTAKEFVTQSYAKYQVKKQQSYSKSVVLFDLPKVAKIELKVWAGYFGSFPNYINPPHVEVRMPLIRGTINVPINDAINNMMSKIMDDMLTDNGGEEDV